jgi:hypothetical protein
MRNHVYKMKLQMVIELTGCIFSTTAVIKNDDSMLWKVIDSFIMKAGTC